jgi:glc operon protein GlcG
MRTFVSLSIDEADAMLEAASRAASRPVSIAVVDAGGALLAFRRMDGARAHTIELATQKARTAAMVAVPTVAIQAAGKDISAGGIPILVKDQCAGAIGVSGAVPEEDVRIACAGAAGDGLALSA